MFGTLYADLVFFIGIIMTLLVFLFPLICIVWAIHLGFRITKEVRPQRGVGKILIFSAGFPLAFTAFGVVFYPNSPIQPLSISLIYAALVLAQMMTLKALAMPSVKDTARSLTWMTTVTWIAHVFSRLFVF